MVVWTMMGVMGHEKDFFYSISNELLFRYTSLLGHGMVVVGGKGPLVGTKSSKPPPKIDAAIGWPRGNSLAFC